MVSRYIYFPTTQSNLSFFMAKKYSAVHKYHTFFIHSSDDGHISHFQDLAFTKNCAGILPIIAKRGFKLKWDKSRAQSLTVSHMLSLAHSHTGMVGRLVSQHNLSE